MKRQLSSEVCLNHLNYHLRSIASYIEMGRHTTIDTTERRFNICNLTTKQDEIQFLFNLNFLPDLQYQLQTRLDHCTKIKTKCSRKAKKLKNLAIYIKKKILKLEQKS